MKFKIIIICCIILFSAFLFSGVSVSAQDGEQSGMIKSAKGILVVWNEPGNYYTIEIVRKIINPAGQPPPILFQVDGHFLQIRRLRRNRL